MIQAIETAYNGYRFRSRLEARWAVFFDALELEYTYEHEGFDLGDIGWYLPDFYFPTLRCYGEVKPCALTSQEFEKAWLVPDGCILLDVGTPKVRHGYYYTGWDKDDQYEPKTITQAYRRYTEGDLYGRIMLADSKYKQRLWYLFGETPEDYYCDLAPELYARQARFEHGETPYIREH